VACYKTASDSSDDTSLTPPTDEKSLVSGPLQLSVPMQAVLRFKYAKGLWFTIYGEFHSHRSSSHNFLGSSCPQVRQQKQLCTGFRPSHFRLW